MQKYRDNITIQGRGGLTPVRNANVTVYNHGTNDAAVIYSNAIKTPMDNPFVSDSLGAIEFYAENGHYDLLLKGSGQEMRINDILMEDVYEEVDENRVEIGLLQGGVANLQSDMVGTAKKSELADPNEGSSTIAFNSYQTVKDKLSQWVSPEDFGAGKPGVTDNDAWNEMFAALNGDLLNIRRVEAKGTYYFSEPLTVTLTRGDITFDGCGSGILDLSGMDQTSQNYLFRFFGPGFTGAKTTAVTDLTPSVRRLNSYPLNVASTDGFEVGDALIVSSLEYFGGIAGMSGYDWRGRGFVNRVVNVQSGTQLHMAWGPIMSMSTSAATINVRAAKFIKNIKICNFQEIRSGTDEYRPGSDYVSAALFNAEFTENVSLENIGRFYNFGGPAIRSNIGINHSLINCDFRTVHQGWNVNGIEGFTEYGNRFEAGRRLFNTDNSVVRSIDPDQLREVVHTNHVYSNGNNTYNAHTGPGGHLCNSMIVQGARTKNVGVGINYRGKNLIVLGCHLEANIGVGAGYDSGAASDPTSYAQIPNIEYLYIDSSTTITANDYGVLISSSVDRAQIDCDIVAGTPIRSWCKYLRNVKVTGKLQGTDDQSSVGFQLSAAVQVSNVNIAGAIFKDLYQGVTLASISEDSERFFVDNCLFDNVTYRFVRADSLRLSPRTFGVTNNRMSAPPSSNAVSGFISSSGHAVAYEYNNEWGPSRALYVVDAATITLIDPQPSFPLFIANGTSNVTLSTINGGVRGQRVTIMRGGSSGTVTVDSSGNIGISGGSVTLTASNHAVTLFCHFSGGWVEEGRYTG